MARPREFDPDKALDKAMRLFWKKGYFDTSIRDIVAETGVSHAGLYGTFGNKSDLFVAALERYEKTVIQKMFAVLDSPHSSKPEIEVFFKQLPQMAKTTEFQAGCLMCNTATELACCDDKIAEKIQKSFDSRSTFFRNALIRAKQKGEVKKDLDTDAVSDFLTAMLYAGATMVRSKSPPEKIQNMLETMLTVLK